MIRKLVSVVLLALIAAAFTTPAPAAGKDVLTFTDSAHINISGLTFFNPCGNGGAGETVVVSGFLHATIHFTLPADGSGTFVQQFNYNDLTGVGLTTGDTYNLVGSYKWVTTYHPGDQPKTESFVATTLFVGRGRTPSFIAHTTMKARYDEDGNLLADISFDFEKCK